MYLLGNILKKHINFASVKERPLVAYIRTSIHDKESEITDTRNSVHKH